MVDVRTNIFLLLFRTIVDIIYDYCSFSMETLELNSFVLNIGITIA